jgi:hypothetical protein
MKEMYSIQVNSEVAPNQTIQKLFSFAKLEDGWDCGVGERPNIVTIERAINLYERFEILGYRVESTPMTSGGITLTFSLGEYFIDVIIHPENRLDLREEFGIGVNYEITNREEDVTVHRIEEVLNATKSKCILFEPLISDGTSQPKGDFRPIVLTTTEMVYLFSEENAELNIQGQSATI